MDLWRYGDTSDHLYLSRLLAGRGVWSWRRAGDSEARKTLPSQCSAGRGAADRALGTAKTAFFGPNIAAQALDFTWKMQNNRAVDRLRAKGAVD